MLFKFGEKYKGHSTFSVLKFVLPMKKYRRNDFVISFLRIPRSLVKVCSRGVAFCMGFHWIKVKGKLASSKEAPILVIAPHSSYTDAFVTYAVLGVFSPVSRKENEDFFIVGSKFALFGLSYQELKIGIKTLKTYRKQPSIIANSKVVTHI